MKGEDPPSLRGSVPPVKAANEASKTFLAALNKRSFAEFGTAQTSINHVTVMAEVGDGFMKRVRVLPVCCFTHRSAVARWFPLLLLRQAKTPANSASSGGFKEGNNM